MLSNDELVQYLINTQALRSENIIDAFRNIDRADFVYDRKVRDIYADYPLQIGYKQTISQPTTVAMMLEMLWAHKGHKVLDIGSGSGWTTALLSFIVGDRGCVTGVERVEELVKMGANNLKKYGFENSKIIQAKDELGLRGEKFDRILVSAAAHSFPKELALQLNPNGKLVIPVGNSIYEVRKKDDKELEVVEHYGFTFVPLIYQKSAS